MSMDTGSSWTASLALLLLACTPPRFDSADSTDAAHCPGLDEAACDADPACASMYGAPEDEVCADDYDNWNSVWAGCAGAYLACPAAVGCGVDPGSGARLAFPSLCVPEGWEACELCAEDSGI